MNKDPQENNELNEIRDLAAQWVIRNDHGLSASEQDDFNDWLTRDPRHRDSYMMERKSWEELDRLIGMNDSCRNPVNPDLLDDDRVLEPKRSHLWRNMSIGMSIAATLIVGLFLTFEFTQTSLESNGGVVETAEIVERIRRVNLEDGSVVSLNRGAEIKTEFSKNERLVRLFDGEANFEVTKDPERPFVVDVFGVRIRAVGTEFNVRFSNQQVDVIVTEGIVAVHEDPDAFEVDDESQSLLEANHRATVLMHESGHTTEVFVMEQEEVQEELLWQPLLIDFDNALLSEIVEEFNRRNPVHIVVNDPELKSMRLSSVFWSDNVDGFIRLLEGKFGVKAQVGDNNVVYLYHF